MDVDRSCIEITVERKAFSKYLFELLLSFSNKQEKIHYCQGMNCVAGFLINVYGSAEPALSIFEKFIYSYCLVELYKDGVPILHKLYYIMEKLLMKCAPTVGRHFKLEGIKSSYYATSWLLTIFTCFLQNQTRFPQVLLYVWDMFLKSKWKILFKLIILCIKRNEDTLLGMKFDQIMVVLPELMKSIVLHDADRAFVNDVKQIQIHSVDISQLSQQYQELSGSSCSDDIIEVKSPSIRNSLILSRLSPSVAK